MSSSPLEPGGERNDVGSGVGRRGDTWGSSKPSDVSRGGRRKFPRTRDPWAGNTRSSLDVKSRSKDLRGPGRHDPTLVVDVQIVRGSLRHTFSGLPVPVGVP